MCDEATDSARKRRRARISVFVSDSARRSSCRMAASASATSAAVGPVRCISRPMSRAGTNASYRPPSRSLRGTSIPPIVDFQCRRTNVPKVSSTSAVLYHSPIKHNIIGRRTGPILALHEGHIVGSAVAGYDGHRGWVALFRGRPELVPPSERWYAARTRRRKASSGDGLLQNQPSVRTSNAIVVAFYERLGTPSRTV